VVAGTLEVGTGSDFGKNRFLVAFAGTLTVNGSAGAAESGAGGTLGGTGTVNVATVHSGGALSPGGTGVVATLSATGGGNALTLDTGSTFLEEVSSRGSFDKVNVTGSARLGNSTL